MPFAPGVRGGGVGSGRGVGSEGKVTPGMEAQRARRICGVAMVIKSYEL